MNTLLFKDLLDSYLIDFDSNWENEKNKWIEINRFYNNFNIDCKPENFVDMLKAAIDPESNMFASQNYYPIDELSKLALKNPKAVQKALALLLDDDIPLSTRIEKYTESIKELKAKTNSNPKSDGYDLRFISTILFYNNPKEYNVYKYEETKAFSEKFNVGYSIKKGSADNIEYAIAIAETIIEEIKEINHPVIAKYREELQSPEYYSDPNLMVFAQNLIWYAIKYIPNDKLKKRSTDKKPIIKHGSLTKSSYKAFVDTKSIGSKPDFVKKQKENSITGVNGEEYVLKVENERLKSLRKKAKRISEKNDALGYDILSYNDDGTKRYIEVKTTNGSEGTTFYITATELEACKKYGENYYLYRLYGKKDGEWKISYYRGKEVEALCNCPYQFAVTPEVQK